MFALPNAALATPRRNRPASWAPRKSDPHPPPGGGRNHLARQRAARWSGSWRQSAMDAQAFCYSTVAQLIFYGAWRAFEFRARNGAPEGAPERKRRAWALSLAVSGLWSFVLAPYFTAAFFWHFAAGRESMLAWCALDTPLLRGLTLHFFAFLVLDCLLGVADYPEHLNPVTTWGHHIGYIILLLCLLYNGTPVLFLCVPRAKGARADSSRLTHTTTHTNQYTAPLPAWRCPLLSLPWAASSPSIAATCCLA